MAELALYRKYRPKKFKDVVGQEQVVDALESAIKNKTVAHAYLFAGSRGTGKTSVARIFAEELKVVPEDIYEIDAASNRGIDEIRALREAVHTLPYRSPLKVYIIDEAHMLTKEAFNALLKTLEEPPAHVVFILATTELDRVIETVVSRCQVFSFKKPSQNILKKVVTDIAKAEGFALESAGAELIALLSDGSFRDAEGTLQKIISTTKGKKIGVLDVERVTGAPKGELLNAVIGAIEKKNLEAGLKALSTASKQNLDMGVFMKLLLERVRTILLLRFAKSMEKELEEEFSEVDFKFLKGVAENSGSAVRADTLKRLLDASGDIGYAAIPCLPLELALIEILGDDTKS